MATNRVFADTDKTRTLDVSGGNGSGSGNLYQSGDPGAVGKIPFVALTDEDSDGFATCQLDGVFDLAVTGSDGTPTATAVSIGDIVYWDDTPGEINVDATNGVRFGYALGAVAGDATTTVPVQIGY